MVDILSDAVDSTGEMRLRNTMTATLRGVPCVPVNRIVGCDVNSCLKFSNDAVKCVVFVNNGILHVAGKKSTLLIFYSEYVASTNTQ